MKDDYVISATPPPLLPTFNGDNYIIWASQMKKIFDSLGLWESVEHGYDPKEKDRRKLDENKRRDAKALYYLQQSLSDSLRSQIASANTAKEAWQTLQYEFDFWFQSLHSTSKLKKVKMKQRFLLPKNVPQSFEHDSLTRKKLVDHLELLGVKKSKSVSPFSNLLKPLSFEEDYKVQLKSSQSLTSLSDLLCDQPKVFKSAACEEDNVLQLKKCPSETSLDSIRISSLCYFRPGKMKQSLLQPSKTCIRASSPSENSELVQNQNVPESSKRTPLMPQVLERPGEKESKSVSSLPDDELQLKPSYSDRHKSVMSILKDEWASCHHIHICEPLIDVVSVTLRNKNDVSALHFINSSNELCELYGEIYLYDGIHGIGDQKCFIFQYEEDHPYAVSGGTLTLNGPNDICPMDKPILCMNIRDKATGEAVIDGSAELVKQCGPIMQGSFEQIHKLTIGGTGSGWSAVVQYLELMFAVHARVEIELENKHKSSEEEEEEEKLDIYGTVTAEYSFFSSEKKVRITLYEKDSDEFELVTVGCPITLSRSVLACPAYSCVTISVKLINRITDEVIVEGSYEFETSCVSMWNIFPGEYFDARVTCGWEEPHRLGDLCANPRCLPYGLPTRLRARKHFAFSVAEVFSIFIGHHQKDKQLSLHGMVNFCCGTHYYNLFYRDKKNPYILPTGCGFLPLEHLSAPLEPGSHFFISVDLQDSEENVVIRGSADSTIAIDYRWEPWFDRPLSYFFKGLNWNSFAVVNYTVFSHAFMIHVKPHLTIEGKTCAGIYGTIVASYRDFGCKTHYDKSFFRTILFERNAEKPLKIPSTEFELEVSRYWIPYPVQDYPLQIKVDLHSSDSDICLTDMWEIPIGTKSICTQGVGLKLSFDLNWGILPGKGF